MKVFIFLLFVSAKLFCQFTVSHQYPNPPCKGINQIQFLSKTSAYAVGNTGLILRTTDGGDSWKQLIFNPTVNLGGCFFFDSLKGYVYDNASLFATSDGGATWNRRTIIGSGIIWSCSFVDENYGWVIFTNGIYRTTDGGLNWQNTMSTQTVYGGKIKFFNRNSGLVVFQYGLYKTVNGGLDWVRISNENDQNGFSILDSMTFYHIWYNENYSSQGFRISTDGGYTWKMKQGSYIVVSNMQFFTPSAGIAIDNAGSIYSTQDTGTTWRVFRGQRLYLRVSDAFEPSNLWVIGDAGLMYRSIDTGKTWIPTTPTHEIINSICVIDSLTMHAVGTKGTYLKTTNGGKIWYLMPPPGNSTLLNFNKVFFITKLIGFTVGTNGTILKTTNAGSSWNWLNSACNDELLDIHFLDTSLGFSVGDGGKILKTTDGGVTWQTKYSSSFRRIYFVYILNKDTVSVGGQICLYSTNGGEAWKSYPSGQNSVIGVSYFNKRTGYGTSSNGIIYKTTTGGTSWTQQSFSGSTASLISFYDSLNGVSIGTVGSYYTQNEFYLTNDGGRTWKILSKQADGLATSVKMTNKNEFIFVGGGALIIKVTDSSMPLFIDEDNTIKKATGLLNSSYPNPFSTFTTIKYSLSTPCFVMLKVYDALGKEICTSVAEEKQPGQYSFVFDGRGKTAGVYFYRLVCGKESFTGKMLLVK